MKYSKREKTLLKEIERLQIRFNTLLEFNILTPEKLTEYTKLVIERQKDAGLLSDSGLQDINNNSFVVRLLD